MSLPPWTLNKENRWHISVILTTVSPLHIGSGEFCKHDDIKDKEGQFVDINACIKGKNNRPIIPGSTIKGKLYDWFKTRKVDNHAFKKFSAKATTATPAIRVEAAKQNFMMPV